MKTGRTTLAAVAAALVLTGAAFDAAAQRRKSPQQSAGRKPAPAAPAPTPAPGKDARPADENAGGEDSAARTTPGATNAGTPSKKNARGDVAPPPPAPVTTQQSAAGRDSEGEAARRAAAEVRYSFEFSQPQFVVSRYVIEHDAAGRGKITFERKNQDAPLTEPLDISPAPFARIVAAWEALRFLDTEESYQADKQFPHLGTMRLRMKRDGRERTAEFNWTHNEHASALNREYRALAEQQFFVFDMALARQYQPSEAIKVLKRLEHLLNSKQVSDAGQLTELLRDLINDERIPLIARNHAERLLKQIEKK